MGFIRSCIVPGCNSSNYKNPELTFHQLPKTEERYLLWLRLCKRPDLYSIKKSHLKSQYVCSYHFEPTMYSTRNLTINAYPTLNLDATSVNSDETESTLIEEESVPRKRQKPKRDREKAPQTLVVSTPTESSSSSVDDDFKWQPGVDVPSSSKPSVFLVETQTPEYKLFGEAISKDDEMDIGNISERTQNSNNMLCEELIIKLEPETDMDDPIPTSHKDGETSKNLIIKPEPKVDIEDPLQNCHKESKTCMYVIIKPESKVDIDNPIQNSHEQGETCKTVIIKPEPEVDIDNPIQTCHKDTETCNNIIIKKEPKVDIDDPIQTCHEESETCNNDTPSQTTDLNERSRKRKLSSHSKQRIVKVEKENSY